VHPAQDLEAELTECGMLPLPGNGRLPLLRPCREIRIEEPAIWRIPA
jgi:hypothetical protein